MKHRIALLTGTIALFLTGCASQAAGYYVRVPPPAPRYGAVGYAPGPGYLWTDGHWAYRSNNYAWVPGRWVRPPRPRATWAPGYWRPHRGGYTFVPGRWR